MQEAANDYQRQARRLRTWLDSDLVKAANLLGEIFNRLKDLSLSAPAAGAPTAVLSAVFQGIAEDALAGFSMMQGKAGEMVALLSGNRTDLNQLALPMRGGNFPIYDNAGASIASVKVRGLGETEPSQQTIRAYLRDFRTAMGQGRYPHKFSQAASLLWKARNNSLIPMPEGVESVTSMEEIETYLRRHAELQIPLNHVKPVRDALRSDLLELPGRYGFDTMTQEQADEVVQRIRPLAVTTDVIKSMIDAYKPLRRALRP